jgi:hypothetical protein
MDVRRAVALATFNRLASRSRLDGSLDYGA